MGRLDESDIEPFSYYWRELKEDYVLLKVYGTDRMSIDGCLIYDVREHGSEILEDDCLANEIMRRMRAAGVPVVFKHELPPGKNEVERIIGEMLEENRPLEEINAAIRSIKRERDREWMQRRGLS